MCYFVGVFSAGKDKKWKSNKPISYSLFFLDFQERVLQVQIQCCKSSLEGNGSVVDKVVHKFMKRSFF